VSIRTSSTARWVAVVPPQSFFLVSAIFHYLGPAFAVLLFAQVSVLGVAWLRIVTAALVFAVWRRRWRLFRGMSAANAWVLVALGVVLAAMNCVFYLAVAHLPLSTVGSIEFLGTILLAALGATTRRNAAALLLTVAGIFVLTSIRFAGEPLGFVFAFANCGLFMLYVILGHRIANTRPATDSGWMSGIDQLGAAMLVAAVAVTPFGLSGAIPALSDPVLLLAGAGVGVCSSVIPYVTDQLAMARLPRSTFALMLALLPATAALLGFVVLGQLPTAQDLLGIALVIGGISLHQSPATD
jgi:inner membrane transporter RhtA